MMENQEPHRVGGGALLLIIFLVPPEECQTNTVSTLSGTP